MTIRKADIDDVDLTYEWATDELVRQNSYSSDEITYDGHKDWFLSKIASKTAHFYILQKVGKPAGLVRIEEGDATAVVGITVAPSFRGQGLASGMLELALNTFRKESDQWVHAYIKNSNLASVKAFSKAGFDFEKDIDYQGVASKLFIWK